MPHPRLRNAIPNAADDAACGLKVSDFMLSFPPVRRVDDLRIRAEAAEAELARLRAQGTWQPIETAPKDREVLLFGPKEFNRNSIVQGAWNAGGAMHMAFWMGGIYKPTHWQPLPAPPEHGGCMTTPQTPPPPMTTLVWKARHDLVQAAGARMEAELDALREALMQVQRCLQDPDEQRGLLKAERVIAAALAATSEPPRQRTSQQYQCDHCRGIWLVEADEHHPRGCTLTNCNGTQSPVTTRDHMLAAPPATGEQP